MRTRRSLATAGVAMASAALVLSACSSGGSSSSSAAASGATSAAGSSSASGSAAGSSSAPGVTGNSITIGLITSETGLAASAYVGVVAAAQARIDVLNAAGGIDGRQVKLKVVDDQSTEAGNESAAASLASAGVFGVIESTAFTFAGYKTLQAAGIPVTGGPVDAGEWGTQPDTNMFNWADPVDPTNPEYTDLGALMKDLGATTVGGVSFTDEPAGTAQLTGMVASSEKLGLKGGYVNTSLTVGQLNAPAAALSLKQSGTNGIFLPMDAAEGFELLDAAKSSGVNLKAVLLPSGYGQSLLSDASAAAAAQGDYFLTNVAPVELNTAATKSFQAALAKYASFTGIPDEGYYWGWLGADLMVQGLQAAGSNLTRTNFINDLHQVSSYTGGGLLASPADLTLANFGKPSAQVCTWALQLEGKSFNLYPTDGKPVCGGPVS